MSKEKTKCKDCKNCRGTGIFLFTDCCGEIPVSGNKCPECGRKCIVNTEECNFCDRDTDYYEELEDIDF